MYKKIILAAFLSGTLALSSCKSNKAAAAKANSEASKSKDKDNGMKPYSKVITKEAKTDEGLFKVHQIDDKYYYEIPNNTLKKDMLLVSRIAQIPSNLGGGYLNAGSKTNEQVVAWERFQDKILLKVKSFSEVSLDSAAAIGSSVKVNNYEPTLYAFDILAMNPDSTGTVIEVTKFFSSDVPALSGLGSGLRSTYKVRNLDSDRSFINSIKSFPENVEVKQDLTLELERELWRLMHQGWQNYRDETGWAKLGEIGKYLKRIKSDFDTRNYKLKKLSDFLCQSLELHMC
jgi:hypothetical protein